MDIRFCTLFSGSSANSTFLEIDGRAILIDAGAGIRKTETALNEIGSSLSKVEAIFITHEHSDHISGLKTILKKHRIPVLANRRTLDAIEQSDREIDTSLFRCMPTGASAVKGDFEIISCATSHDAAESVCYVIRTEKGNFGVITDLGEYSEDILAAAGSCKALVLESNHDEDMLWNGSYHPELKKRVFGASGHLSNRQCGELLSAVCQTGLKTVFLAHLSQENNTPALALTTVCGAVEKRGVRIGSVPGEGDLCITVSPRNERSLILTV